MMSTDKISKKEKVNSLRNNQRSQTSVKDKLHKFKLLTMNLNNYNLYILKQFEIRIIKKMRTNKNQAILFLNKYEW